MSRSRQPVHPLTHRPSDRFTRPGLFITGTDTGVGKTVITCAIAAALRRAGLRVGVCKPIATGCRRDREGLVSEDAEALAHFSDCRLPLAVINPVRYRSALAPAAAAEIEIPDGCDEDIDEALQRLAAASDILLIEGIGGILVPLDEHRTVLDLMTRIGYPALVVTRGTLGTLNHTAMTCRLIRQAGLPLAGLVINRYRPDTQDLAEATNPRRLARQNHTSVLATVADHPAAAIAPHRGELPLELIDAITVTDWSAICKRPGGRV